MKADLRLSLTLEYAVADFALRASLQVGSETVALVGPNGAGKTTLLLAILGICTPQRGYLSLAEQVLFDAAQSISRPTEERQLAYLPQDFGLFPFLSAAHNVAFAIACRGRPVARSRRRQLALEYLERFGIAHLAARLPGQLSGGERQRVALARAVASQPGAILLDEPTAALDVSAREEVRRTLRASLHELAIPALMVTHDWGDVSALATRLAVMEAGQLVACVAVSEAQARPPTPFVARLAGATTKGC